MNKTKGYQIKPRFSFVNYIINMTCASTAFSIFVGAILTVIFSLLTGGGMYVIILGMFVSIFPTLVGLISGFFSSLLICLVASRFFNPESISEENFKNVSFAIVATISVITLSIGYSLFIDSTTISLPEIGLGIVTTLVIMSAHYFASRYLVTTIEKRKEK